MFKNSHALLHLQLSSWLVAVLVMAINGYLLVSFFSSEVNGVLVAIFVFVFIAAYLSFVVYLVYRSISFSSWHSFINRKTSTDNENWVIIFNIDSERLDFRSIIVEYLHIPWASVRTHPRSNISIWFDMFFFEKSSLFL